MGGYDRKVLSSVYRFVCIRNVLLVVKAVYRVLLFTGCLFDKVIDNRI